MNQNEASGNSDRMTMLSDPADISPYLDKDKKSIVLFEMNGCPYCRMFEPRFIEFAEKNSKDYAFLRVTLDDPGNPLWGKYDIIAVPTVIVFSGDSVIARADSILGLGLSKKKWSEFCDCL